MEATASARATVRNLSFSMSHCQTVADMRIRSLTLFFAVMVAVTGCDKLNRVKSDNPVMGPPPPRVSLENDSLSGTRFVDSAVDPTEGDADGEGVTPVAMAPAEPSAGDLSGTQVVATVDGMPIFASEVLERYSEQLAMARQKMPPDAFQQARLQLIKRDLQHHIDRKVLVLALERTVPPAQLKELHQHLEQAFEEDIARLRQQFNVTSTVELQAKLREKNTSLTQLRSAFINQQMAMQFLGAKSQSKEKIGREELLQYYHEHADDYTITGRVTWQQLLISWGRHGGRTPALRKLEEAIEQLRQGTTFDEVARKFSDGPTAADGGNWDWTPQGSLADERVNQVLFELEVGKISQVLVGDDTFQLVKVVSREDGGMKEFHKVQDSIREQIRKQRRSQSADQILSDLRAKAMIETIFDTVAEAGQKDDFALPFE